MDTVTQNIQSYLPYLDTLYVMDNSETALDTSHFIRNCTQITYFHNGQNEGIAQRLNQACQLAIAAQQEWLLTMDQDSSFEQSMMEKYLIAIQQYPEKEKVAMFGVKYDTKLIHTGKDIESVDFLITSGSIVNIKNYKQVGGFDTNLFIDEVDLDYCYNAIVKKLLIIKFSNILLQHNLGHAEIKHSLKNWKKTERIFHSPIRIYYMVRNYLYIKKKYGNLFKESDKIRRAALLNRLKNNLIYKKSRIQLLKLIYKAIQDFRNNKMGKIDI